MTIPSRLANFVWHSSQHLLAVVVTALSLSVIPVAITIIIGLLGVLFGLVEAILVFFGGHPPIIGSVLVIILTLALILITLVVLILILVLAHIFSALVVTPVVLFIHWSVERWQIKSRITAMVFYLVAGITVGAGLGLLAYLWMAWSQWQRDANLWALTGIYAICLFTGLAAVFIYQSILFSTDTVRLFLDRLIRHWSNRKEPASSEFSS